MNGRTVSSGIISDSRQSSEPAFSLAVRKFVADLKTGRFRRGLCVRKLQGADDTFEMTWSLDGRALFRYGDSVLPGEPHVLWLRVGSHAILDNP